MQGHVIGFDPDTSTGAISGPDGKRYDFATADWRGQEAPGRGDLVDFTLDGERATLILLLEPAYLRPGIGEFYFSPRHWISRSQYWLGYVLPAFGIAVILRLAAVFHGEPSREGGPFMTVLLLFYLVALWPGVAVLVKRIHDRNKSGWLALILYIPLFIGIIVAAFAIASIAAGNIHLGNQLAIFGAIVFAGVGIVGIWFLVEFGCLRGTIGANQYGPDPVPHN